MRGCGLRCGGGLVVAAQGPEGQSQCDQQQGGGEFYPGDAGGGIVHRDGCCGCDWFGMDARRELRRRRLGSEVRESKWRRGNDFVEVLVGTVFVATIHAETSFMRGKLTV